MRVWSVVEVWKRVRVLKDHPYIVGKCFMINGNNDLNYWDLSFYRLVYE